MNDAARRIFKSVIRSIDEFDYLDMTIDEYVGCLKDLMDAVQKRIDNLESQKSDRYDP